MYDYFNAGMFGVFSVALLLVNLWLHHKYGEGRRLTLWDFHVTAFYAFSGLWIWLRHSLALSQVAQVGMLAVFCILGIIYLYAYVKHKQQEAREWRHDQSIAP